MPFIMSYDKWGVTYTESYWVRALTNTNDIDRYGVFTFNGYATVGAYNDRETFIDQRQFVISNPNDYNAWIYPINETLLSATGTEALEAALLSLFDFFDTATQVSSVAPRSAELGNNGDTRITMIFTQQLALLSGTWDNGVTIKIDGVTATLDAASQNPFEANELRFDLHEEILPGNVITFEYDMAVGHITDASGFAMSSIPPFAVTSTIGRRWDFSVPGNSGQFALLF